MKKVKAKGGNCMIFKMESCYNDDSIKKTDWCYPCRTYIEKYMFYDFEATQNTGTHTVNLSIAQDFEGKEYIHNSIEEFCKGFLNDKFKGYTFIAHNSKRYDCHFVLKWLIDQGIKPYCIYNGAKIMFMEIPKLSIRFIDSLNFLQIPLKSFPKTFGMSELKKGYFPHYFNKECNKDYVGNISSKKHYGYNQMKPDERTKFLKWYEERVRENYVFDFKKEILEYCRSDVDILRRGIMKLREDFIELENIDPLRYITIASVCMTIYRSNYMPNKTIAIVPEYAKTDNFSKMSIMWLNYVSTTKGLNIQHALNGSEKKLTIDDKTYKVDGFCEKTNTVYEFYDCFWHGCPNCYKPNIINSKNQTTDVSEFYEILLDDKLGNKNFQFINDDMVQMTYNFKDQFVDNSNNTNIYIACFTTSHARLMLYDKLDYLNEKVLYFDTDSIIYTDDNTKNIETSDMLGDMTDEISGKGISSFVSTGPKSYSFKYDNDEQKSAIKGFTLNHENNNLLNHDSLSKIVKRQIREITIVNESKITRKNREIVNKYCEKIFKFGYDKRVIKHVDENHIDTLPYGY